MMNVPPKNRHPQQTVSSRKYRFAEMALKSKSEFDALNFLDFKIEEIPKHLDKEDLVDYYAEELMAKASKEGYKIKTKCPKLLRYFEEHPTCKKLRV